MLEHMLNIFDAQIVCKFLVNAEHLLSLNSISRMILILEMAIFAKLEQPKEPN